MKATINGNKLIAEFMELESPDGNYFEHISKDGNKKLTHFILLEYHLSWDCLMPVVDKIESFGYWIRMDYGDVFIVDDDSNIIIENPMHEDGYTKLDLVYDVVVEFIEWHNEILFS